MLTGLKKSISKEINFAEHENMNMGLLNNHVCYATEVDDEYSVYAKDTDSHTAYIVSGPILRNFQYCTLDLKKH